MTANPIDWNEMLLALRRHGIGLTEVSAKLRIPKTTIYAWSRGTEPRHQDGETFIAYWMQETGGMRESLPRLVRAPDCVSRLTLARSNIVEISNRLILQNH